MPSLSQCCSDGLHDAHTPKVTAAIVRVIEEKNTQTVRSFQGPVAHLDKSYTLNAFARQAGIWRFFQFWFESQGLYPIPDPGSFWLSGFIITDVF